MTSTVKALLGVSRAPFLLLPVVLVAAGAAASAADRGAAGFSWARTLLALVGLVLAHAAVNTFNEARDMETGVDLRTRRTPFSGGSGTLPAGALSVEAAYGWGLLVTAAAAAIGVAFLVRVGWVLLPVLLLGALAVLGYAHAWSRLALGEVFAGLGLGLLPVWGASLVQDGRLGAAAVAAGVPAFFMTMNLLLLNEFPDAEADRSGGRRHLVILLGRSRAAAVWALAVLATPLSIGAAVLLGAFPPLALVAIAPTFVVLRGLRWALRDPQSEVPLPALAGNVIWNLATNLLLALALGLHAAGAPGG